MRTKITLASILILALVLRIWGIGFGLPYKFHIDEPYYVLGALKLATGEFRLTVPHNTPNIWQFLLLVEYGAMFVAGKLVGVFNHPNDIAALYLADPSILYLLARLSSVLFGVATVGLTYQLGKVAFDRLTGIIAALFLAVAFLHARDSHYAVNDAFIAFLTTFACYAAIRYWRDGDRRLLLLGFAACGAAVGMKYRPIAFALPLAVVLAWRSWPTRGQTWRSLLGSSTLALAAFVIGFVIGFPGVILNTQVFLDQFGAAVAQGVVAYEGWIIDTVPAWFYYVRALAIGMGIPMLAASVLGISLSLKGRKASALFLLMAIGAYFVLISLFKTYFARYALPLVPILAVFAGYCISQALVSIPTSKSNLIRFTGAALMVACLLPPLISTVRHDHLVTQTDTRTLAKVWIEENLPQGARIAVDWPVHGPPLSSPDDSEPNSLRTYDVMTVGGKGLGEHSLSYYRDQAVDYLVTSSFISNISVVSTELEAKRRAFYYTSSQELELVKEFWSGQKGQEPPFIFDEIYGPFMGLWQRERPGPTIKIYRISHE